VIPPTSTDSLFSENGNSSVATAEAPRAGRALVPANNRLPVDVSADWGDYGLATPSGDRAGQGVSPLDFVHALRRRWGVALASALAVSLVVMVLMFYLVPFKYMATAVLQVSADPPSFAAERHIKPQPDEVERFKNNQMQLAKSLGVIHAVLRRPEIDSLATLRAEGDNKVEYLMDEVTVAFASRSDLMVVSLSAARADDAKKIVEAMVRSYLEEIVFAEQKERAKNIQTLGTELITKTNDLNKARKELSDTVEALGAIDETTIRMGIDTDMRRLTELSGRMSMIEQEARTAVLKAVTAEATYLTRIKPAVIVQEASKVLLADQFYQKAQAEFQELMALKRSQEQKGIRNPHIDDTIRQREDLIKSYTKTVQTRVRDLITKGPGRDEVQMAKNEAAFRQREAQALRAEYVKLGEELKKKARRASELNALRDSVEKLQTEVKELSSLLFKWNLEQKADARVERVQDAAVPPQTDYRWWALLIGGGVLGFLVSGFGVGCWEYSKKRLNSVSEVSDRLRLSVVGTLPKLSGQAWLGRKSPTQLETILSDSIDSIRAALIHGAECGRRGAVMVTSAWDGEGKTTVASQLAVSLARCGRRTLLVDADLRSPTLHELFEMPLGRGLGEVLRGDIEVEDGIRPTQAENLKLLSAGTSDYTSIQALENDSVGQIFDRLKEQFDFIVVDTAPVLAFADPLLIGQHMDGAVLSVRLDVSQRPKVEEAVNRLRTVGINLFGAVVNGTRAQTSRRGGTERVAIEASVEV
jgi:succinoglycan biosynthesis transport protein ExoP